MAIPIKPIQPIKINPAVQESLKRLAAPKQGAPSSQGSSSGFGKKTGGLSGENPGQGKPPDEGPQQEEEIVHMNGPEGPGYYRKTTKGGQVNLEFIEGTAPGAAPGATPESRGVPMDPNVQSQLESIQGLQQRTQETYEDRLRRLAGAQAMATYRTEGPGGELAQTAQQMGSRGMGRMAQISAMGEQEYLHNLLQAQNAASETARSAALEISGEIRALLDQNLKTQSEVQAWDDAQKTHMSNQFNEAITIMENVQNMMMETGSLDTEAEWEALGETTSAFLRAWLEAETDEERRQAVADHYGVSALAVLEN